MSEELPKNGDVLKSPLPAIGSLDAIGGTKNIQNSISARIADVAGVRILDICTLAGGARFELFAL